MAWTRRRGHKWLAEWRSPDGKLRSKGGFDTKKAAKLFGAEAERKAATGIDFDPKAGAVTFREVAEAWLESRRNKLKPSTFEGYRYALAPASKRRGDMRTIGIDAVWGGYPLNKIYRDDIRQWVADLTAAGKKPSTVCHAYEIVKMVLADAVINRMIPENPADYVELPTDHTESDVDVAQFLTAAQVAALEDSTPWPYNIYVHTAAWTGLRAAELCGLRVGDIDTRNVHGNVNVERVVRVIGGSSTYFKPKTKSSIRTVPLMAETTELLREYLSVHPRRGDRTAPLFPAFNLIAPKPTGQKAADTGQTATERQAHALAALSVEEAKERLGLDWTEALRHPTFYKGVYQPAVIRANRAAEEAADPDQALPSGLKFHSLRHTYASLCADVGIRVQDVATFMGHASERTTESVYTHLFPKKDHSEAMGKLGGAATRSRARRLRLVR